MNLAVILDLIADGLPDRVLVGDRDAGPAGTAVRERAAAGAGRISEPGASRLLCLVPSGPAFPVTPTGKVLRRELVALVSPGHPVIA